MKWAKKHQQHGGMPTVQLLLTAFLLFSVGSNAAMIRQRSEFVSGTGDFQFRFVPLRLPSAVHHKVQDGHGLVLLRDTNSSSSSTGGEFMYTFHPKTNDTQVLVRFSSLASRRPPVLLGNNRTVLSSGVPHGLEQHGGYLYHANNAQRVTKTTLDGDVVWSTDLRDWATRYPEYWPILPTDVVVVDDLLFVADGYGSSWIHVFNKTTGEFVPGKSFGGVGNTTHPLRFSTPHGIAVDYADPRFLIISDRSNQRLVWVSKTGDFVKAVHTTLPLPCNVDNSHRDDSGQHVSVIPSLGQGATLVNGSVGIYRRDTLVSTIEVAKLLGRRGHQHPHDAIWLPNGDLVVCCWSGPSNPGQGPSRGTISYWQRVRSNRIEAIVQR